MQLHRLLGRAKEGYTTFGCVWEKGEVRENSFRLLNENGEGLPMQSNVSAYWPDKSIKWSTHTADADKMSECVVVQPLRRKTEDRKVKAADGLKLQKNEDCFVVDSGKVSLKIPVLREKNTPYLACDVRLYGELLAKGIYPVFQLEGQKEVYGEVAEIILEQEGFLQTVFCFKGNYVIGQDIKMPFLIRMYLWHNSAEIRFVHTFFYDGIERRDFLKGMGIRMDACLMGKAYNRHVQFTTDGPRFSETAMQLCSSHPRIDAEVYRRQQTGEVAQFDNDEIVAEAIKELPIWNRYSMCQDSAYHFKIRKQTRDSCCMLTGKQGRRALGVMAVTGEHGGIMLGMRDFWQKYPAGLEVTDLAEAVSSCTAWFYSPEAECYDFRHYDTRSYPRTCYEGFDEVGADAVGIAVTSECQIRFVKSVPTETELYTYAERIQKPCVYVGAPEYYYDKRAFGYWSLPNRNTEVGQWFEKQLEKAFLFFKREIDNRDWYGLFDYGDIMHTYDPVRHVWRYDMGGYAWQNTELVPTYWLWLYFLRTGREDVFTLAEAMTRHCSEVDIYHFGKNKGLGSRHNVRHWGCSCKEPRISMAGHQRFLYYLTGDFRLGDVMDEVKEADYTMVNNPYANEKQLDGTMIPGIRSGPDWSSFVSNWMTAYERTLDSRYLERIQTGIQDISATPYGLASGPDYYYDVEKAHLIYKGEVENTPNQHLQICMGGVQVWLETAMMLEDDTLNQLLADLGGFYLLSPEEKSRRTNGQIKERPFSWPLFATSITAYSAMRNGDGELAKKSWEILLHEVLSNGRNGYEPVCYAVCEGIGRHSERYQEIPWINTNYTAQWCLNVIMCMEFIPEYLEEIIFPYSSETLRE